MTTGKVARPVAFVFAVPPDVIVLDDGVRVTDRPLSETKLPNVSSTWTVADGLIVDVATVLLGCWTQTSFEGPAAVIVSTCVPLVRTDGVPEK
jgi:hypothetical protein